MGSTARKQCSSAIIMFVIVTVWTSQVTPRRLKEKEASLSERHEQWMAKYGKTYKDFAEKERRLQIFKNNVEFIESFNAKGNKSYKVSINEFADQTSKEFMASSRRIDGLMRLTTDTASFRYGSVTAVPDAVDWRSRGAVTPINAGGQGACGNSWAFATVAATEGIYEITTGKLVRLSQQELVDCWGSLSTEDGYYEFIVKHGITSESNYPPSTSCNDTCNTHMENSPVAHIKGYEKVPSNSEDSLLKAVANQPVSAGVDGASQTFQFYSSGVFEGDCGTDLNLGVAVVGYGGDGDGDGTKYWIVKNSWGASWGEGDYIRIKRGIKEKQGLCGIAMDASYPVA